MYTPHGHHIAGTPRDEAQEKQTRARCGGPGFCDSCSRVAARHQIILDETHSEETLFTVGDALRRAGLTDQQISDSITEMLNAGVLFREQER